VESIPVLASALPFAGRRSSEGLWSAHVGTRGVSSPSANSETDDHGVLEQPRRRGTFSHLDVRRRTSRQGEVLCSSRLDPRNSSSSFQPRIGATGKGLVVPPASGAAKSGGLRRSILWQACSANGWCVDGVGWLAARLSRERRATARRASSKGVAREARVNAKGVVAPKEPGAHGGARIGRSRGVPARCYRFVAEVDRQRWTQRSVRTPSHPIWVAYGDGGLVRE